MKKTDSPSKTSFSLDPTRKKIFSDITKNNLKNKSDHQFLINQAKCNTNLNNIAAVQIPEETDSRSSSMVSSFSIHNLENTNKNLNNSMVFNKPKNVRSFGTTFGRKIIQLPGSKRNMKGGFQKKNHSIFDHFINEVNEKLMERQLSKETGGFFQKSLNMKVNEDDESSDLPDFLSW